MHRTLRHLMLLSLFVGVAPAVGTAFAAPGDGPAVTREGPRGPAVARRGDREDRLLQALQQKDPERYRKLVEVRDSKPRMYRTLLMGAGPMLRLRDEDPGAIARFGRLIDETYTLHTQIDAYAKAEGRVKARISGDIRGTVARLFDLRQEARRAHIAALEARLADAKADVDQREANKDALIDDFTRKMLGALDEEPGF